ncbi:hypothetical protein J7J26_02985 [Candidatus Micrarchaeota archaeon]|nr:hypothetical protein [Candidatus Micrarchaeota archaeon]
MGENYKGQISAEMLIVLAVLVAVAVFLAMQLTNLGKQSAAQANQSMSEINCQQACMKVGLSCDCSDDCPFGLVCENGKYKMSNACPPCD